MHFLVEILKDGFTPSEYLYAIHNSSINWSLESDKFTKNYVKDYISSRASFIDYMIYEQGFRKDDVISSINKLNINWKEMALELLSFNVEQGNSFEEIEIFLAEEKFTNNEIYYAMSFFEKESALEYARKLLDMGYGYSKLGLTSIIVEEFSNVEMPYVFENLEVDWNKKAILSSKYWIKEGFSIDEINEQLVEEGFTTNEINYALNKTEGIAALLYAESMLESEVGYSKYEVNSYLEEYYSASVIEFVFESLSADWNKQAVFAARYWLEADIDFYDLEDMLYQDGFKESEVDYALSQFGKENALAYAKALIDYNYGYSKKMIERELETSFTKEEMDYTFEHLAHIWKDQAVLSSTNFLIEGYIFDELEELILWKEFSFQEMNNALTFLENNQILIHATNFLKHNSGYSETSFGDRMKDDGYLKEDIIFTVDRLKIDWFNQAVIYVGTKEESFDIESIEKSMTRDGFTEEQINYAIMKVFG